MSKADIKNLINTSIRINGSKPIIGSVLNPILNQVVDASGADDSFIDYTKQNLSFVSGKYTDLSSVEVGAKWDITLIDNPGYGYNIVDCAPGDIFILKTSGNTVKAKAYTFFDEDWTCLSFNQPNYSGEVIAPEYAAHIVVNSIIGGNEAFYKKYGKIVLEDELEDELYAYKQPVFESGNVNYLTGALVSYSKAIRTPLIRVRHDLLIYTSFIQLPTFNEGYIVKYLNGVYVGYQQISLGVGDTETIFVVASDSSFNEIRLRFGSASDWNTDRIQENMCLVARADSYIMRQVLLGETKYNIGNYDNEFSFDTLFAGQLTTSIQRFQPNFEVPTNGAFLSTDIDYTGTRTSPISDEQMLRANVPYFYVNGEKRGTIVLYDENDVPFIYDKQGNKITLQ